MIRDAIFLISVLGMLPISFRAPHVGVLLWGWFAFMHPHREAWNVAGLLRINLLIALVTIIAWILSREPKRLPMDATAVLLLTFAGWITLTTLVAISPVDAEYYWGRTVKTLVFIFMILIIMQSRVRVHAFMWIIAVSLGYWAVKGGLFFILSGGRYRFFGPDQSMIYDNNHIALALVITLPLLNYLRMQSAHKYVRLGLAGAMLGTVASVLVSYSRGGLLGLLAAFGFLWLKSKTKLVTLMVLIPLLASLVIFAPESWKERIGTMEDLSQDSSFLGRLHAWEVNLKYAIDHPITGAGFYGTVSHEIFWRYVPEAKSGRAAHSIYFQVLGDHGFVGLGLYLLIAAVAWHNASWIMRRTRSRPDFSWAYDLAAMIKVSLFSFFVAGAALSMAYYDVYFALIAVLAITRRQVALALAEETERARPLGAVARGWQG